MESYDVIVIGAGVIEASVAFHLGRLGAGRVLVLDRNDIGTGTTAQSSGILRTHYSVKENIELARRSWDVFRNFAAYVEDDEASSGLVNCGYLIAAPEGPLQRALEQSVTAQRGMGIHVDVLDRQTAAERLPIGRFDDAALIAYEPDAGFADPYLVTHAFAKAARRMGVEFRQGVAVNELVLEAGRIVGVDTDRGRVATRMVVSAQNIWSDLLERCVGRPMPVKAERFPAYETAGLAASWTGVYDVTPDWNPVLGRLPGVDGLVVGFSGHGLKLSPLVGRVLAQEALGLATDVSLAPYSIERFERSKLLVGKYGSGAVS